MNGSERCYGLMFTVDRTRRERSIKDQAGNCPMRSCYGSSDMPYYRVREQVRGYSLAVFAASQSQNIFCMTQQRRACVAKTIAPHTLRLCNKSSAAAAAAAAGDAARWLPSARPPILQLLLQQLLARGAQHVDLCTQCQARLRSELRHRCGDGGHGRDRGVQQVARHLRPCSWWPDSLRHRYLLRLMDLQSIESVCDQGVLRHPPDAQHNM